MSKLLVAVILILFSPIHSFEIRDDVEESLVVFCYWGAWALYRPGAGRFGMRELRRAPCTHVCYSFVGLTAEGDVTSSEELELDGNSNKISDFISLKDENPNLTLLVSIGGWAEGSENFSTVSNNASLRTTLVQNLVEFIQVNSLDGLDVDWEYPGQRGGSEGDKEAFVLLLRELRAAFSSRGWLLTAAVASTQYYIDTSYDVPAMNELLDYINLMTYDYHGSWSSNTGANAPLYPQLSDPPGSGLNVDASVNTWINNGASPEKLLLGLANYGRSFTLSNATEADTGAPFDSPGEPGNYTAEEGFLAYYEICTAIQEDVSSWSITEVNSSYVYGNKGLHWVGYDNNNTIYAKAAYSKLMGLGGMMFWAVDLDDFSGLCGTEYPLTHSAVRGWRDTNSAAQQSSSVAAIITAVYLMIQYLN